MNPAFVADGDGAPVRHLLSNHSWRARAAVLVSIFAILADEA